MSVQVVSASETISVNLAGVDAVDSAFRTVDRRAFNVVRTLSSAGAVELTVASWQRRTTPSLCWLDVPLARLMIS